MKRTALIIFSYALFSFVLCLVFSFFHQNLPVLLPGAKTDYIVFRGLLYFYKFAPALILCGFLIGCSIAYGVDAKKAKMKYSTVIMAHFRKTMIAAIGLVFIMTFINEFLMPVCQSRQKRETLKPAVFNDFMTLANEYYAQGNMELAFEYSYNAVEINPKDERAVFVKEHSEAALNSMKEYRVKPEEPKFVYIPRKESKGETVYSLIQKAQKAAEDEDWFNAHYYAYMAVKISNSRDINRDEAQRLASEAWNHLFESKIFKENEENVLFKNKRDAYMKLVNGDNIDSYYKFIEIAGTGDRAARDPDVAKFLKIAEERVHEQCFFVEEVEDLIRFETSTNVYFAVSHDDGTRDVVFIRGITPVKNSGRMIQYLRGLSILSFDKEGQFVKSIVTPYAKMISQNVNAFDDESKARFGIKDSFKSVPYILLEGISQKERQKNISPVFEFDAELVGNKAELPGYTVLGLSMNDFNLLSDVEIGSDRMSLISLMKLLSKAKDFGFPLMIYNAEFLSRITQPLLMLVVCLFISCIAWNYRLPGEFLFKFKWVFLMPVISILMYFVIECLSYIVKLLNFMLVSFAGSGALLISIGILVILMIATSYIFVTRVEE